MYLVQRNTQISKPVYDFFVEFIKSEVAPNDIQLIQLARGLNGSLTLNDFGQADNRVLLWQLIVCTAVRQFTSKSDMTKYVQSVGSCPYCPTLSSVIHIFFLPNHYQAMPRNRHHPLPAN